jgi:hypothetical protein
MGMGLDKRQRWAIGAGVLAVGALFADRFVFLPGPATATAAALEGVDMPRIVTPEQLVGLATRLQGVCDIATARPSGGAGSVSMNDPFASPWAVPEEEASPVEEPEVAAAPLPGPPLPVLTSIVQAGGRGYAVLDGRPLGVGGTRDGYTLVELTDGAATVSMGGSLHTLPLHTKKNSP